MLYRYHYHPFRSLSCGNDKTDEKRTVFHSFYASFMDSRNIYPGI